MLWPAETKKCIYAFLVDILSFYLKQDKSYSVERFEAQLSRLKAALRIHDDQGVAEQLGLSRNALALRKMRGAFPEDQLVRLAAQRPELGLDVVFILTGSTSGPGLERHLIKAAVARAEITSLSSEIEAARQELVHDLTAAARSMSMHSLRSLCDLAERVARADASDDQTSPEHEGLSGSPSAATPIMKRVRHKPQ